MTGREVEHSEDLPTERYVRVAIEAEADPCGDLLRAPRWSTTRVLAEGEEFEPGPHNMVISVPAEPALELTRQPLPWDAPGTYEEWQVREEAKHRHPAGRALTGSFTQSHPWLAVPEPAEPIGCRPDSSGAAGRVGALEARVAELESRVAALEGQGDVVEMRTYDGGTRAVRVRPECW
jgi:hypothetical protein